MKQQTPERTRRLAVIAAAAVILVMVLLIIETFRLLLPGLWTAFSSGDEQALSDYLTSEGRLRSFLTLWFLAFVQVVSLVIPAMPVQLAAGIAYGPWKGFVTSFSASVAANFLVFLLARRLAKVIELLTANSPKANKLLNSVRKRNSPAADYEEYLYAPEGNAKLDLDEMLDEWGREFFAESRRRIDLIRYGKFSSGTWWDKTPDADKHTEIWPIMRDVLNANHELVQNPGYNK